MLASTKVRWRFRSFVVVVLASQLITRPSLGDHLPESLIARSEPEFTLAGISVRKPYLSLGEVERRWGHGIQTPLQNANNCDRLMLWRPNGVKVTGSVGCEREVDGDRYVVYTVEVSGVDITRHFGTGRGLCLGDSLARIAKLYGHRMRVNRRPDGTSEVLIQWHTGTELNASIDDQNRVSRIQLLPQIE